MTSNTPGTLRILALLVALVAAPLATLPTAAASHGCDDGFEDGTTHPFTTGGGSPWQIDAGGNSGSFSARSGTTGDGQSSYIEFVAEVQEGAYIEFARRVSSEAFYDELVFSIDGVFQDRWSGEVPWHVLAYPVPGTGGVVTFRWTYAKDVTLAAGADGAWIDDVRVYGACHAVGTPAVHRLRVALPTPPVPVDEVCAPYRILCAGPYAIPPLGPATPPAVVIVSLQVDELEVTPTTAFQYVGPTVVYVPVPGGPLPVTICGDRCYLPVVLEGNVFLTVVVTVSFDGTVVTHEVPVAVGL